MNIVQTGNLSVIDSSVVTPCVNVRPEQSYDGGAIEWKWSRSVVDETLIKRDYAVSVYLQQTAQHANQTDARLKWTKKNYWQYEIWTMVLPQSVSQSINQSISERT